MEGKYYLFVANSQFISMTVIKYVLFSAKILPGGEKKTQDDLKFKYLKDVTKIFYWKT